ncbi:MAG: hypothetical protein ACLFVU_07185 [Phycisphaerae bacterium]
MKPPKSDKPDLLNSLLQECSGAESVEDLQARLQGDPRLRKQKQDLQHTFSALELLPEEHPPEDLMTRTVSRAGQEKHLEQLLARQEARHGAGRSTFSLKEVIAAAAVIILLASLFVPSMFKAGYVADRQQCASNAGRIGNALLAYASEHGGYLPQAGYGPGNWLTKADDHVVSNSEALYKLVDVSHQYASPDIFQCPATGNRSFVATAGMADFPAGDTISYSYHHSMHEAPLNREDPELVAAADQMAILADRTPVFESGRFLQSRVRANSSSNHDHRGQNVLYLDGSVRWAEQPFVGVDNDNIFLVRGVYSYQGNEVPASKTDTFLLPAWSPN